LSVFTLEVLLAMQTLVSVVGVPSQVILVGSKRAPTAPVIGP
jgi:hypothetical protein